MRNEIFNLNNIRIEISFKTFDELRLILSFCQKNNLCKINIPCKNLLKNDFLLNSIKLSREEFPNINIIPHFSILHEFRKNKINTQKCLIEFLNDAKHLGCDEVLVVSGSQKRSTLDSVSALLHIKDNPLFNNTNFSIGVAFNPYLPGLLFDEEIIRLQKKLKSGLVRSIWFQFGTDSTLLERRIGIISNIMFSAMKYNSKISNINLFGSILIPSKQFLARFKYRPWKGVLCSTGFLESVDSANYLVAKLLETYKRHDIQPIIETNVSRDDQLNSLKLILQN